MKHIVSLFVVFFFAFAAAGCGAQSVQIMPEPEADGGADGSVIEPDAATADGSMEMDASVDANDPDGGNEGADAGIDPCAEPIVSTLIVREVPRPDPGCWDENVLLGQSDVEFMALEFTASGDYVSIEESLILVEGSVERPEIVDTVRNIRMVDEEGTTIAQTSTLEINRIGFAFARLRPLLVVSTIAPRRVMIIVDIASEAAGGVSGMQYIPTISEANEFRIGEVSVRARSAECGIWLEREDIAIAPEDPDRMLWGFGRGVLRTELTGHFAENSPNGLSTPSAEQIIVIFETVNTPNVGNFPAIVRAMALDLWTDFEFAPGRMIRAYRDSFNAVSEIARQEMPTGRFEGTVHFPDEEFADIEVSAGSSRHIIVTLDTRDAEPGFDGLFIGFGVTPRPDVYGLEWSDGVTDLRVACYDPEQKHISY